LRLHGSGIDEHHQGHVSGNSGLQAVSEAVYYCFQHVFE
jgi:hypothetical protein